MSNILAQFLSRCEPLPSLKNAFSVLPTYGNFFSEFWQFKKEQKKISNNIPVRYRDLFPQLLDRTQDHGFDRHYIYHTAWAARVLAKSKPRLHIDISSSLYFSAIASAFVPIKFYDFRRIHLELKGLKTARADLTHLHFKSNSLLSVSCMHTIEHIGLGRYGDPLDPNGDLKAIQELIRVVSAGGQLLIVVPVGKETKVMFNAHRIYSVDYIKKVFTPLKLKEFALIPEHSEQGLICNPRQNVLKTEVYACGCFWFVKPKLKT